uniref:Uncharacterized protein n=1 Tax=Candidozyma auris TaxID=498019 RepID=A0A0L0P585_CANAR
MALFDVGGGIVGDDKKMRILRSGVEEKKRDAQARNRTGGPTMATLDFTTKPLARDKLPPARIELATFALQVQRSTTKLRRQLELHRHLLHTNHINFKRRASTKNTKFQRTPVPASSFLIYCTIRYI